MLDHQEKVFIKTQFSSSNCDTACDVDFDFWGAHKTQYYDHHFSDFGGREIEFQVEEQTGDACVACSPPLWRKSNTSKHIRNESYPLLPGRRNYSDLSPRSRSKAVAEGRKELMEMIQNMPESFYELSLKDIVDEQQKKQEEAAEKIGTEESSFQFETQVKIKKQKKKKKKKKSAKAGQMSRSGSMYTEIFMIKMFFPSFVGTKKKKKPTGSKVSPRPSFEGSENCIEKQCRKKRFLVVGKSKNRERNSNTSSKSSRQAYGNFSQGCWPLFHSKKSKSSRQTQRGCIF